MRPPLDLGGGHRFEFTSSYSQPEDVATGGIHYHPKPDGSECVGTGAVTFRDYQYDGHPAWDVVQEDPLTLSPSLQCRTCGSHGHICEGKWVPA